MKHILQIHFRQVWRVALVTVLLTLTTFLAMCLNKVLITLSSFKQTPAQLYFKSLTAFLVFIIYLIYHNMQKVWQGSYAFAPRLTTLLNATTLRFVVVFRNLQSIYSVKHLQKLLLFAILCRSEKTCILIVYFYNPSQVEVSRKREAECNRLRNEMEELNATNDAALASAKQKFNAQLAEAEDELENLKKSKSK